MYLEKILTFVLFLGPLVFFHELGHFFFARFFGVRVEVFSIGFGPKILKWKRGETEYAVSIIPLGGYVKMFGDDPFNKEAIPEAEKEFSYNHKNKWARFWIVLGGPLTNFILAFFIFYSLLFVGEKFPEIKLGSIDHGSALYASGIRTGDVLLKVNDSDVYNPSDLSGDAKTTINKIEVRRHDEIKELSASIKGDVFFEEVMKHPPFLRKPFLIDSKGNKYILTLKKQVADLNISIEEIADRGAASGMEFFVYPLINQDNVATENLKPDFTKEKTFSIEFTDLKNLINGLYKNGFYTLDLMVKSINFKSPADNAGVKPGDIFVSLNAENVLSFEDLRDHLQKATTSTVDLALFHNGELKTLKITPEEQTIDGKKMRLLGVYSHIEIQGVKFIQTKSKGIFGSAYYGVIRTWDSLKKMVEGLFKLITNQIPLKTVGGVLTIGKVANDSFNISFSYFLQLMALISINLGVINLFPMLPLDGGHITFIFLELINGGPVSRRKMEIAQQIGLSILLMLMVGSIFNDVTRFF
jgi:regulator of sigma E protease